MRDSFGRTIDYIRVSVTDRCNFRCVYCMPDYGIEWKPHGDILSFEEIIRLCRIFARLGIRAIKVTGGEPLVRRGCVPFIKNLKTLTGIEQVTLTTNGFLLSGCLDEIAPCIDGINISLDSLDPKRFAEISGGEGLDIILGGMEKALAMNIPVKVNCVPIRGFNEHDIVPLAVLAKDKNVSVRFIELMPLGLANGLHPVSGEETAARIKSSCGELIPFDGKLGNGPAKYFSINGFKGKIGFINAMTGCFCESCNRLRLTSQGLLKPCLSSDEGADLKPFLRLTSGGAAGVSGNQSGVTNNGDAGLEKVIRETILRKPARHSFSGRQKGMFHVGG